MNKDAYRGCRWCNGNGCLQCPAERAKNEAAMMEPIFTADKSDPEDMRQLNEVFGIEAIRHAFGPDGEGMREIETNAALASFVQALRKSGAFK